MQKFLFNLIKPFVKKEIIKYINNEDNQKKYVKLLNDKVDLPNMDEEAEKRLIDQLYDALQVATIDMIEEI